MAGLPQTAAGTPSPGVDPTAQEIEGFSTVADIMAWLGIAAPVKEALALELGAEPKIRDVVYIRETDWNQLVEDLQVTVPVAGGSPTIRKLKPLERGHLDGLRRISRLRLGLTALPGPSVVAAHSSAQPTGDASLGGVGSGAQPPAAEPKLKLSAILDPSLDSDLVRLAAATIRKFYNEYRAKRGGDPAEEIEPTDEQVSAIAQVLAADLNPYADFSLFGPYGRRMLRKLVYLQWIYLPGGKWQRQELAGPPDFAHWWASFRVLRTALLLLDSAATEPLDNYGELLRSFDEMYGSTCWFILYDADVKMRSEHFPRLRRQAENGEALPRGVKFNELKPWAAVWQMAAESENWWNHHLHRPAGLFLSRCKTASEVISDGTVQPFFPGDSGARSRSPPRRSKPPSTPPPRQGADRSMGPIAVKNGVPVCQFFNTSRCHFGDRCQNLHVCSRCGKEGHPAKSCASSGQSQSNGDGRGRAGQPAVAEPSKRRRRSNNGKSR